jgi:GDPmannose 4,6-dehydratase
MNRALITGITGQDGLYLTQLLLEKGYEVYGTTTNSAPTRNEFFRKKFPSVKLVEMSLLDSKDIVNTISAVVPNEIYNLASISSVARSILEPELTHEVNALGPVRIINAISNLGLRNSVKMYQASSSEMFGKAVVFPQDESTPLNPVSPYATSKALAHQYCGAERAKGMFISCGILFNHESPYRSEGFVSKKICRGVVEISLGMREKITLGSLTPERDWGFSGDYVEAMWAMLQQDSPGDFVISTGRSRTIQEFLDAALSAVNLDGETQDYVAQDQQLFRPSEITKSVGDASKAKLVLNWSPRTTFEDMVALMVENEVKDLSKGM